MRPYRGLTKECKWVYGWYVEVDGKHYIIPNEAEMLGAGWENDMNADVIYGFIEVIPKTVGQQIGSKDNNNKDLDWWEDDIFDDDVGLKVIVKDKGCFWFELIKSKRRIPCYQVAESDEWSSNMRKIGNIHQNPKLMEQ